ncbi:MAG: large conductance mechanosensitive channel protein MscL [Ktedonobacteraceae bacterium]
MISRARGTVGGFKTFLLRGNVVDLAVGIVIGVAFGTVVTALVGDVITPLIPAPGGNLSAWVISVPWTGKPLAIGSFINAVISFVIIAAAVYYLVVLPVNTLMARFKPQEAPAEPAPTRDCPYCLSSIPAAATRCPQCTSPLPAVAQSAPQQR